MTKYLIIPCKLTTAMLLYLLLTACASVITHGNNYTTGDYQSIFYTGTMLDIKIISHGIDCSWYDSCANDAYTASLAPFSVLDLPFSVLLDTLLLPFDVIIYYRSN